MICEAGVVKGRPPGLNERLTDLHLGQEVGEHWGDRFDVLLHRGGVVALGGAALIHLRAGVTGVSLHHHRDDPLPGCGEVLCESDGDDER